MVPSSKTDAVSKLIVVSVVMLTVFVYVMPEALLYPSIRSSVLVSVTVGVSGSNTTVLFVVASMYGSYTSSVFPVPGRTV